MGKRLLLFSPELLEELVVSWCNKPLKKKHLVQVLAEPGVQSLAQAVEQIFSPGGTLCIQNGNYNQRWPGWSGRGMDNHLWTCLPYRRTVSVPGFSPCIIRMHLWVWMHSPTSDLRPCIIHFPHNSYFTKLSQGMVRGPVSDSHCTSLAIKTVVNSTTCTQRPAVLDTRTNLSPPPRKSGSVGLAQEWFNCQFVGVPQDVTDTIQNVRAPATWSLKWLQMVSSWKMVPWHSRGSFSVFCVCDFGFLTAFLYYSTL